MWAQRWRCQALIAACLLVAAATLSVLAALFDRLPGGLAISREVQTWTFLAAVAPPARLLSEVRLLIPVGLALAGVFWLKGHAGAAFRLLVVVIALQPVQMALKESVDRPRPPPTLVEIRAEGSSPSFPAGHVFAPTLFYGSLAVLAHREGVRAGLAKALGGFALSILILSGPVNVHLGVHWPSDVLGGYLWGLALVTTLWTWLLPKAASSAAS